MPTNPTTGAPYLDGEDAPDLAGITKQIADWTAGGRVVLHAVDEAERDALYSSVPSPALCVSAARPALWIKTGDTGTSADWQTVWSDTGWVATGVVAGGSFTLVDSRLRRIGDLVQAYVTLTCNVDLGPTNASGIHAGNLAGDPTVFTLPAGWDPDYPIPVNVHASFGTWGGRILSGSGICVVMDGPTAATLSNGDNVTVCATYLSSQ